MRYHPIMFTDESIRAILAGRKTQTRRVVKPPKGICFNHDFDILRYDSDDNMLYALEECQDTELGHCPYGQPGDRLWVREAWMANTTGAGYRITYRADCSERVIDPADEGRVFDDHNWRPSIHMPRWASRITLEVTGVRVERVQDIAEEDAIAEGCGSGHSYGDGTARTGFAMAWDHINAKRGYGWDANPWVWVVEFRRVVT